MTDLEITKLCAEAMGYLVTAEPGPESAFPSGVLTKEVRDMYRPLHDDAQAMGLVKRFRIDLTSVEVPDDGHEWGASWFADNYMSGPEDTFEDKMQQVQRADLNRAICECVAKMQQARMLEGTAQETLNRREIR